MTAVPQRHVTDGSLLQTLNGRRHERALAVFMIVVIGHWAEHVAQAIQIWGLHRPVPKARGVLGEWFPWLVTSEALHYGYALVMLVALVVLRSGFTGRARRWWTIALVIQFWHHIEHLLLIIQAQTHTYFFGGKVPTSVLWDGRFPGPSRAWLDELTGGSCGSTPTTTACTPAAARSMPRSS